MIISKYSARENNYMIILRDKEKNTVHYLAFYKHTAAMNVYLSKDLI